jgi:hypothetical protein
MSSHTARTHTTSAPPRGDSHVTSDAPRRSGLSLGTLVIAAVSSAVAATVVSKVWQAGTVMATAMTPVIIAVVKEAIERPAQRVSSVATRSGPPPVARAARAVLPPPPEAEAPPPPMTVDPQLTQMRVYGRERSKVGRRWKLAVATGLLGFVVCVAAMTLPELVAGRSVVSGKHDTTIFGGHRRAPAASSQPDEKTKTDEKKTTTEEVVPEEKAPTTKQPDGTTTTAPQQPAPRGQQPTAPAPQTQPAPTQTQPSPAAPQPQPAPATP